MKEYFQFRESRFFPHKMGFLLLFVVFLFVYHPSVYAQQTIQLKGKVTDQLSKEALPFVSVFLKGGGTVGTSTDMNGEFDLQVPAGSETLEVSFVGYKTAEIAIGSTTQFAIALEADVLKLDETVVVGYQTRVKSSLTGSVKSVSGNTLQDKPIASFDQALQGRVAGLLVTSTGSPGAASKISIRGISSLSNSTTPLFILDGVQISSSDLSSISAGDIETYTVLKDAAATSIYGALAANGVVLVNTKKGRNMERTEVRYAFQLGASSLISPKFTMMNTSQLLQYEESLGLRKLDPTGTFYLETNERKDSLMAINTNWQDEIYRTGMVQSHELSLRGGNDRTRYFASTNYYKQDGILKGSTYERIGLRVNLDHDLSRSLTVGIMSMLGHNRRSELAVGSSSSLNPVLMSQLLHPYLRPSDDDGNLLDFEKNGLRNISLYKEMTDATQELFKSVVNVYAEWKITPLLKFKTSVGADYQTGNDYQYESPAWEPNKADPGFVNRGYTRDKRLMNTNLLTYIRRINDHNFNVLVGQETATTEYLGFGASGTSLPNDKIPMLSAISVPGKPTDNLYKWATISYFTQGSYNYQNKYFVDLSLRRDGSSRFARDSKWGTFWAVGGSWQAKREAFLMNNDLISSLTFTASTGTSGNSNIGPYAWMGTYAYGQNYNGQTGSVPNSPLNNNLRWETVHKNNAGVEISFKNLYRFKLEGYYNLTTDMLLEAPISLTSGFTDMQKNVGSMSNKGVEFEWDLTLLRNDHINWAFTGNIAYSRTHIKEMNDGITEDVGSVGIFREGSAYGLFYLVRSAGVDPLTGVPLWYTKDGDITSTFSETDRVISGKSFRPNFSGGFGSDFTYDRFTLSVYCSWVSKRFTLNEAATFYNSNGKWAYNQSTDMLNHWTKPGDLAEYPDPKLKSNQVDDRYLQNTSFLRLKNVALYYTLDPDYLKQIRLIKAAKVYVQAQNLLTLTSYKGFDPESTGMFDQSSYPNSRIFTFGVDFTF